MSKNSRFGGPFQKQHGNRAKHCCNQHHSTFSILIDHCQVHWVAKSLSHIQAKSSDCFLSHWLTIKNYPVLNRHNLTIPIQMQLPQNKKSFLIFLLHFWNVTWIFELLTKKMTLIDFVIPKLRPLETRWDKDLKSPISENPSTSNMVNVNKHCRNLYQSTFMIFIDHCEVNWLGKSLCFWEATSWDCLLTHWLPMKCILFLIETI